MDLWTKAKFLWFGWYKVDSYRQIWALLARFRVKESGITPLSDQNDYRKDGASPKGDHSWRTSRHLMLLGSRQAEKQTPGFKKGICARAGSAILNDEKKNPRMPR